MAQTYQCDICNATTADFMVTYIANGEVVAVGIECLLDWALPQAEAYQAAVARQQAEQAGTDTNDPGTQDVTALDPPEADSGPVAAPAGADDQWEADYPQGRSDGGDGPPNEPAEETSEVVSSGAAADVPE